MPEHKAHQMADYIPIRTNLKPILDSTPISPTIDAANLLDAHVYTDADGNKVTITFSREPHKLLATAVGTNRELVGSTAVRKFIIDLINTVAEFKGAGVDPLSRTQRVQPKEETPDIQYNHVYTFYVK